MKNAHISHLSAQKMTKSVFSKEKSISRAPLYPLEEYPKQFPPNMEHFCTSY